MKVDAIVGFVRERPSGKPIPDARVRAYDRDAQTNDLIGEAATAADGRFEIARDTAAFAEFIEDSPDVVFDVQPRGGGGHSARRDLRWSAGKLLPVPPSTCRPRRADPDRHPRTATRQPNTRTRTTTTTKAGRTTTITITTSRTTTITTTRTVTILHRCAADGAGTLTGDTTHVMRRSPLTDAATST